MVDLNKFAVDVAKETGGTWVQIDKESSVRIARMDNKAYRKELDLLRAPYKQSIKLGELDEDIADDILNKVLSRTILLDWKGFEINGVNYPYSEENCLKLLSDPKYSQLRNMIISMSSNIENFRIAEVSDMGNASAPSSDGNLSGARENNS